MNWEKFSSDKNIDSVETHKDFLKGGLGFQSYKKIIVSDPINKYRQLLIEYESINEFLPAEFPFLITQKCLHDLADSNLISRDKLNRENPYDFQGQSYYIFLNDVKDPLTPAFWQVDQHIDEIDLTNLRVDFYTNEPHLNNPNYSFGLRLNAEWRGNQDLDKFEKLWNKSVRVCTTIVRTMELRLQNLIEAIKLKLINRAVRNTTFLDIFSDKNPENAPLFQVYIENKKYLEEIEEKLKLKLAIVPVLTEWILYERKTFQENYTFDLQRIIEVLRLALISPDMGFYIQEALVE